MTVTAITVDPPSQHVADGATKVFAIAFMFQQDSDIIVKEVSTTGVVTTVSSSLYTVSGAGDQTGGSITYTTAPASGITVLIDSAIPLTQGTDYVESDAFPAATHENALDKLTLITKQLNRLVDRCVKFPDTETIPISSTYPVVGSRQSQIPYFNSAGLLDYLAVTSLGSPILVNAPKYDTVAGVRGITDAATIPFLITLGTVSSTDGVWGLWNRTATSGGSGDNTGTKIVTTSESAVYERVFTGPLNAKWFGCVADGVTDDSDALQRAWDQYTTVTGTNSDATPDADLKPLYFPAGNYLATGGKTFTTTAPFGLIFGEARSTRLANVKFKVEHKYTTIRDLFLTGSATYGVLLDDGTASGSLRTNFTMANCYITGKTDGLKQVDGGKFGVIEDCQFVNNTTGVNLASETGTTAETGSLAFYGCLIDNNTNGILVTKFTDLRLDSCNFENNTNYGISLSPVSGNDLVNKILINNCNLEDQDDRTVSISSFADAGGGKVTATCSASHLLAGGQNVTISGTTNYNGTFEISGVTATTFDFTDTWVATETGTVAVANWDVIMEGFSVTKVSDVMFTGGSIDYLRIADAHNVTFHGTQILWARRVESPSDKIVFYNSARGRSGTANTDTEVSGSVTGWQEFACFDDGDAPATPDNYITMRVPSDSGSLVNGYADTINEVKVGKDDVVIQSEGTTTTIDGRGISTPGFTLPNRGTLTIASAAVTVSGPGFYTLVSETAPADDTLETINGGTDGDIIVLRSNDSASDITLDNGTGNLNLGSNFVLNNVLDRAVLLYDGVDAGWAALSLESNGA